MGHGLTTVTAVPLLPGWNIARAGTLSTIEPFPYVLRSNEAFLSGVYQNNGDGTFSNRVEQTKLDQILFTMGANFGDFNNDGQCDLYFTANMESNRLYLNKGDFLFEDVSESSGTGGVLQIPS